MSRRKPLLLSLVILVGIWALQTWGCSSSCRAVAIWIPPASPAVKQDGVRSVFHGRRPSPLDYSFTSATAAMVKPGAPAGWPSRSAPPEDLADSKRRVPSCPDPLHNR